MDEPIIDPQPSVEPTEPQSDLATLLADIQQTVSDLREQNRTLQSQIAERDAAIRTLLNNPTGKPTPSVDPEGFKKSLRL